MTKQNPTKTLFGRRLAALASLAMAFCLLLLQALPADAQEYRIRPGDTLLIEVLEDPSLNRTVLVAPDGRISLPSAGVVRAGGRTVETVQNLLTQRLESNFANTPNVFVAIQSLAERRERTPTEPAPPELVSVFVVGEANTPGKIEVEKGTTILQMFAIMGGFTNFAATKRIQLRRTDPQTNVEKIFILNYKEVESGTAAQLQSTVADGDVIFVPQRRLFE